MANFRFRLQTLLRLRAAARDQRRAQLAEAYKAERILRQQAEQLSGELDQVRGQMRQAAQPGEVNVDSLLVSHRYELVIQAQKQNLDGQIKQILDEIERRRVLVVEADRQVRILERLRQRQQDDHNRKQQNLEVKEMDEIAARQHRHTSVSPRMNKT